MKSVQNYCFSFLNTVCKFVVEVVAVFQVPQLLHAIGFTLIIDNSIRGNSLKSPTAPNLPNVMVSGTRILSDFGRATIERSQPRFGLDSIENVTGIDDKGF